MPADPNSVPSGDAGQPETPPAARQTGFRLLPRPLLASADLLAPPLTPASLDGGPDSLPDSHSETAFWCVARDPHWIFAYWQLAIPLFRIPGARLVLILTRVESGGREATFAVEHPAGSRFLPVSRPGLRYCLTLGFLPRTGLTREELLFAVGERVVFVPRASPVPKERSAEPLPVNANGRPFPGTAAPLLRPREIGETVAAELPLPLPDPPRAFELFQTQSPVRPPAPIGVWRYALYSRGKPGAPSGERAGFRPASTDHGSP